MNESRLERSFDGRTCLYCFYSPALNDWIDAIDRAKNKHKVKNERLTIICAPKMKECKDCG